MQYAGERRQQQDDHNTFGDPRRAGRLEHQNDLVDHKRHDQNIHDVHDPDRRHQRGKLLEEIDDSFHNKTPLIAHEVLSPTVR